MAQKDIQTLTLSDLNYAYNQNFNISIAYDDGTLTTVNIYPTNYGGDWALKTPTTIATAIQSALVTFNKIGAGNVSVVGVDNLDDSYTFTISFASGLGDVPTITLSDTSRLYNSVVVLETNQVDGEDATTENFTITSAVTTSLTVTDNFGLNVAIEFIDANISSITGTYTNYQLTGDVGSLSLNFQAYTTGYKNVQKTGGGDLTEHVVGSDGVATVRHLIPSLTPILSGTWKPINNPVISGYGSVFAYNATAGDLQTYFVGCGLSVTVTGGPLESGSYFVVTWNTVGLQTTTLSPSSYSSDPTSSLNLRGTAITYSISSVQDGIAGMFGYNFNPIILADDDNTELFYIPPKTIEMESIDESSMGVPIIKQKNCKRASEGWRYYYPPLAKTPLYNQRKGAWVAANTVHIQNLTGKTKYCKRK